MWERGKPVPDKEQASLGQTEVACGDTTSQHSSLGGRSVLQKIQLTGSRHSPCEGTGNSGWKASRGQRGKTCEETAFR